jgi:hypothetical protein
MKRDEDETANPDVDNPSPMTAAGQLDEVGFILAAGIRRLDPEAPIRQATLPSPAICQADQTRDAIRSISPSGAAAVRFDQKAVARRWGISPRTLERWRWYGTGPRYLKIGGRVLYRLEDIEAYEVRQLRG